MLVKRRMLDDVSILDEHLIEIGVTPMISHSNSATVTVTANLPKAGHDPLWIVDGLMADLVDDCYISETSTT